MNSSHSIPPWSMAVTSMLVAQLSLALSVGLIEHVGAGGSAFLRLLMGALLLLLIARPPLKSVRRHDVPVIISLGVASGVMALTLQFAIELIPLGTAVAIEFLGPLTVAAVRSSQRRMLLWPALALVGVLFMTEPWHGAINLLGVLYAVTGAVGWATYILLTQRVGDRFSGTGALSMTIPIAALVASFVGLPQAWGHIDSWILLYALGIALGIPVISFSLELTALRHMTQNAFGTLMALEPAFALLLGLIVLFQIPTGLQLLGIALVVVAGASAQRGGTREPPNELEREAQGLVT